MPALSSANLLENEYFDELVIRMWLILLKIQGGGKRSESQFPLKTQNSIIKKNTQQKILESSELQHSTSTFNNIKRSHVQGSAQGPAEPLRKLFSEKKSLRKFDKNVKSYTSLCNFSHF